MLSGFKILRGCFNAPVLLQPFNKLFSRVSLVFLNRFRKQHSRLYLQQSSRKHQKLTGNVQVIFLHLTHNAKILLHYCGDRYIINADLILFYKGQQQIQRALKVQNLKV